LIDIKDDYRVSLPLLVKELAPLRKYLSSTGKKGVLTIIISGNRPAPTDFQNYSTYIFFDDDLRQTFTKKQWKRVALVSLPFTRMTRWNGRENLPSQDSIQLKKLIDSVHAVGKPIRFWAAPDNERSWKTQMNLKIDLIGTDKTNEMANFLRQQKTP
jgi:alkaline phosphatase